MSYREYAFSILSQYLFFGSAGVDLEEVVGEPGFNEELIQYTRGFHIARLQRNILQRQHNIREENTEGAQHYDKVSWTVYQLMVKHPSWFWSDAEQESHQRVYGKTILEDLTLIGDLLFPVKPVTIVTDTEQELDLAYQTIPVPS